MCVCVWVRGRYRADIAEDIRQARRAEKAAALSGVVTVMAAEDDEPDIQNQGDLSLYSIENMVRRRRIKRHPKVQHVIKLFWTVMEKDNNNRLAKEQYIQQMLKAQRALAPEFDEAKALRVAEDDWVTDVKGASAMDYEKFCDSVFEVVDIWCDSVGVAEYVRFLYFLLEAITTVKTTTVRAVPASMVRSERGAPPPVVTSQIHVEGLDHAVWQAAGEKVAVEALHASVVEILDVERSDFVKISCCLEARSVSAEWERRDGGKERVGLSPTR